MIALLLIPALFFLFLEIGLRAVGTGYPTAFLVPVADEPGLVADNFRFAWRFFPRALARSPQPILVTKDKPPGTKRVIVFGGSAAMGDPEPAYGLPRLLEVLLESRFRHDDFEVINAAVTAVNSHVVLPIVRECRHLDADAWIVYLGNNEVHGPFGAGTVFGGHRRPLWLIRAGLALNRTKIGQLSSSWRAGKANSSSSNWGGMAMFLEHQIRHDHPDLDRVYANFRRNLTDILSTAVHSKTPVIISTLVTNLKDSPPFVSLHREGFPEADRQRWQSFFAAGCQAQSRGDLRKALVDFAQAEDVDAEYAELHYRQGQCYLQLGDSLTAHEKFRLARDYDTLRFRADSTINRIIRSTVQQRSGQNVILVDGSQELARQIPDGIIGDELLHEHVHLNFAGNYRLARLLGEKLAESLNLSMAAGETDPPTWLSEQACADRLGLTTFHQLLTLREMRGRLNSAPFNRQINHHHRDEQLRIAAAKLSTALAPEVAREAIDRYRQLIEHRPDDWVLRKQFSILLESAGDLEGALEQYEQITNQLAHHPESLFRLGALLNRTKKWEDAEQALRKALAKRPDFARAANSLGICLSHQGRYEESIEQFRKATELRPTFAEAYLNWGLVLAKQGDDVGARERYLAAIAADPDYFPAHDRLGKSYVAAAEPRSAPPHYIAVARLKPNDPIAHLNLGLLYLKIGGHHAEATHHLQRTLELDPGNRVAQQAIRALGQQPPAN